VGGRAGEEIGPHARVGLAEAGEVAMVVVDAWSPISRFVVPTTCSVLFCWLNRNPTSTCGVTKKPRFNEYEKESFGSMPL
jgi:hypothetical protein